MNVSSPCKYLAWGILILFVSSNIFGNIEILNIKAAEGDLEVPTIAINIAPYKVVYEGDIIDCDITGDPTVTYWQINNQSNHDTFYGDDPVIFNPEPTPLKDTFVNLTVYVENEYGSDSDTVPIKLNRIFFGDIHWHTLFSDGDFDIDTMYRNAIDDNYLDFAACSDHGELLDGISRKFGGLRKWDGIKTIIEKILGFSEWQIMKDKAVEYYNPGNFTTLLGFEWTAAQWSLDGKPWSPYGWEDVGHINFYYKDVYPNAREFSDLQKWNYNSIFKAMADEWDKGHLNIGYPHHPLGRASWINFTTNWTYMTNHMSKTDERNKILRGVECYSRWGTSIGDYYTPGIPWLWPYKLRRFTNQTDAWVENALWEWSDNSMKNQKFVFMAGSDSHEYDRPGSALFNDSYFAATSGIIAVNAVHNTRDEIWDAMNNCNSYALQLLKIRASVSFDGQLAYGRWINCSSPLKINITAHSTFPGFDRSGKRMWPHGYSPDELDYPITDIWLVKKDREKGRPWCKVINHTTPEKNMAVVLFEDADVQPNDFYWVAIRQKGQLIESGQYDEYMAFIGPVFINNVN